MTTNTVQLGDICREPLANGVTVPGSSLGSGVRLVNVVDLYESHIIDTKKLGRAAIPQRQLANAKLRPGDILFVRSSVKREGAAMCSMFPGADEEVAFGCFNIRLRPDAALVDSKYVTFFLRSAEGRRRLLARCNTSTITNISQDGLASVSVPLPKLCEQQEIAAQLERADRLRRMRGYAFELSDTFLQSVFLEMFGDPETNPKDWDKSFIDDVLLFSQYGTSQKSNSEHRGYPVLGMGNITTDGRVDLSSLTYVVVTKQEFKKLRLEPGDVIFNRTNSTELVGKTACWSRNIDAVLASYLIRLKLKPKVLPEFFAALLNTQYFKRVFKQRCKKAVGQSNISPTLLREFAVYVPPLTLQQQFAAFVRTFASLRAQENEAQRQAEHLFRSLLIRAFANDV